MNPLKNNIIIGNLYYLCVLIVWVGIAVIGLFALLAGVLFLCEKLFPERMHAYNYTLSAKTFDELKAGHHYHAAINFMEYKQERLLNDDPMALNYMQELCDCYMRVGDYSKAEKKLLELYNESLSVSKALREEYDENNELHRQFFEGSRWSYAQELFKVYDLMGSREGMLKAYRMMEETDSATLHVMEIMKENGENEDLMERGASATRMLMSFYRQDAMYYDNPDNAIDSLRNLLEKNPETQYGIATQYRIKLIGWMLEQDRLFEAYGELARTVDAVESIQERGKYEYFGELIDHCLQVGDYDTGKRLLKEYWHHVRDQYGPQDMEYIRTQIRELKIHEKEGRWDDIESAITDICRNLRPQIEKNFIGMSEEQREFFAKQVDVPFSYAVKVLQQHPTPTLAALCLDNQVFRKGLLLRSSQVLRNTIARSGDPGLVASYDSLVKLKQELRDREYLTMDPRNSLRKRELKQVIDELDKSIALGCTEYATLSDTHSLDHRDIQRFLNEDELLLELVDAGGSSDRTLFAILMGCQGSPEYIPLCRLSDISWMLRRTDVDAIYSDRNITSALWRKIEERIRDGGHVRRVYYSPSGLFCQLALHALPFGSRTLGDRYSFHQLSNCQNLASLKEHKANPAGGITVSLWGGITYSLPADTVGREGTTTRGILRGDSLVYLPSSNNEVKAIARLLGENGCKVGLYQREQATEGSFKDHSGGDDIILHVSTHGFFKEDSDHGKDGMPMYNSGLFFAGANDFWMNDSIQTDMDKEDGILRAMEIQDMNLINCRLAILSACDTGLGYVDTDEGVYGLQRAFKLAGVEKVMMSLWPVSDYHTSLLMQRFYTNIFDCGMDYEKAYEKTLTDIRTDGTLSSQFEKVSQWGGFVLLD